MSVAPLAPIRPMPWDANLTWADLQAIPDDGNQYEVIGGELYVMTAPIPIHQELIMRLAFALHALVTARDLGRVYVSPIAVELSDHDIVQPDILFIAKDRLGIVKKDRIIGAPDLVVEAFSPSTRSKDRMEKTDLYARSGVREYWQVDPRWRSVMVLALQDGAYQPLPLDDGIARSSVLPDLAVEVAALFADLI
jgi:Uma2 family endonuclease